MSRINNLYSNLNSRLLKKAAIAYDKIDMVNCIARNFAKSLLPKKGNEKANIDIGANNNAQANMQYISLCEDSKLHAYLLINSLKAALNDLELDPKNVGKKYLPLPKIVLDSLNVSYISEELADIFIENVKSCDLSLELNQALIEEDADSVFNYYVETVIDATKKLYTINCTLYQSKIRPNSSFGLNHSYVSHALAGKRIETSTGYEMIIDPLRIYRVNPNCSGLPLFVPNVYTDENGKNKVTYKDPIDDVIRDVADEFCEVINTHGKQLFDSIKTKECIIPELDKLVGTEEYNVYKDLYNFIRAPYGSLISSSIAEEEYYDTLLKNKEISYENMAIAKSSLKEEKESTLEYLSNLARFLLDGKEVGKTIFALSKHDMVLGDLKVNYKLTNQLWSNVCSQEVGEFLLDSYKNDSCPQVCGSPIVSSLKSVRLDKLIEEGEVINFTNGQSSLYNIYLKGSNYSGQLKVAMINDKYYGVKPLLEVLHQDISYTTPLNINVYISSYKATNIDDYMTLGNYKAEKIATVQPILDAIKRGTKFTLQPNFRTVDGTILTNVFVVNIDGVDVPIANYNCNSELVSSKLAGLTCNEILSYEIAFNGNGVIANLPYGIFESIQDKPVQKTMKEAKKQFEEFQAENRNTEKVTQEVDDLLKDMGIDISCYI